ncbi:MAG: hypothetical protein ABIQ30_02105 [Devosia sp.]
MISIEVLVNQTEGLNRTDVEHWVRNDWVRPAADGDILGFGEIDVARVILIRQLRDDLEVNDAALPIVLSLIDQLYDLRRHLRQLGDVMEEAVPDEFRTKILRGVASRNAV